MLETETGGAHNIATSTLAGFTLPGDVSASKRYWNEDLIEPEVEVTSRGTIRVPKTPGIGYAARRDLIEQLTVHRNNWSRQRTAALIVSGPCWSGETIVSRPSIEIKNR